MKRLLCAIIAVIMMFQSVSWAQNSGYSVLKTDNGMPSVSMAKMATGQLPAMPNEYWLAFLMAGYNYKNIADVNYFLNTGRWERLKKDVNVKKKTKLQAIYPESFDKKRLWLVKDISLKKGDLVFRNGANVLLTEDGGVVRQQHWEYWRTDTFCEIVNLVGEAAIIAAGIVILHNATRGKTTTTNDFSSAGSSGGPGLDPVN